MYDPLDKYLEKPQISNSIDSTKKKKKKKVDPNAPKVKKTKAISIVDHDNVPQINNRINIDDDDAPVIVGDEYVPTEIRARVNAGNTGGWVDIKLDVETVEEAPQVLITSETSALIKERAKEIKELEEKSNKVTESNKSPSPVQQGEISPPRRRRSSPSPPRRRRRSPSPRRRDRSHSPRRRDRSPSPRRSEHSPRRNRDHISHPIVEKNSEIKIKKEPVSPQRKSEEQIESPPRKREKVDDEPKSQKMLSGTTAGLRGVKEFMEEAAKKKERR